MADSKLIMLRIFLLSFACLPVAVCAVYAAAPAPADDDPPISNSNTTAAINTSSALPLRPAAGAVAPSMSTRHDLDTDGGGGSGSAASSTLCLHRVSTQSYDGGAPLEDGSGRLLFWKRDGQVWLAEQVDAGTTGSVLRVGGKPLIDLRTNVSQDSRGRGLAGVAVDSNSRVYVSYYTNIAAGPDGGGAFIVVDQLSVSWSEHEPTTIATATRVFSMGLVDQSEPPSSLGFPPDYYGGQILFRPTTNDPNLYLVTGPAQTNGQLQAEILRLPMGQDMPSGGNGTDAYASVFGVPRRCEFDVDRPQDLYCAIVKDDQEQVFLVSDPDAPSYSTPPPVPSLLVAIQRPSQETPPSLVGGLLYRGDADTTLAGSYIYMHGSKFWAAGPSRVRNSSTTRSVRVTCSASAPAATTTFPSPCHGGDFAGGATVTSFGQDADKNAILLATDATYQVVAPSLCDTAPTYTSPKAQQADPTSNNTGKDLLVRILKVIGIVLAALVGCGGLGYALYRMILVFNCCTITNEGNAHFQMGNIRNNYYYGSKA